MTADATVKAFKRAPSVEMSTWYKGILISNLATEQDTGGAFEFFVTRMKKGTEPPPHVHEREHEMFYVLERNDRCLCRRRMLPSRCRGVRISAKAQGARIQDSVLRGSHAGAHDARWLYERKRYYGNPSAELSYPAR